MDVSNDGMNSWLTNQRTVMNGTDDVIFYTSILEHLTLLWVGQKKGSQEEADYEKAMKYVRNKLNEAQQKKSGCIGRACSTVIKGFSYITGRGGRKRTHRHKSRSRRTHHRR